VAGALIRPEAFYQVVRKKRKRTISDHKSPERDSNIIETKVNKSDRNLKSICMFHTDFA
jgi:hypothetical protein